MDDFSDSLARSIISDVLEDIRREKNGQNSKGDATVNNGNSSTDPTDKTSNSTTPKVRKRKTVKTETDIDILANRLTYDIISHATYSGKYRKRYT